MHYILETHAHADHLSGAQLIKDYFPHAKTAIGSGITVVQDYFKNVFNLPDEFPTDGRQFDHLLGDNEILEAGSLKFEILFTPGHTPACASFKIDDALFTGDALFMPDMGTGRCDFPAGSVHDLYDSITNRIYSLPGETRVFVGHDYQPGDRDVKYVTTVAEQKKTNVQLRDGMSEEEFTRFRSERDKQLAAPKLLLQSIQINIDAGAMPESDGETSYLKIPLNVFRPEPVKENMELTEV